MLVKMNVSSDEEECVTIPEFVDVQVEGDDNVVIKSLSTDDPFLNKLVGNGNFIGTLIDRNPPLEGSYVEEADPEEDILDMKYKNANPPPTNNPPVIPIALRAKVIQELNEVQAIPTSIDSCLENIDQFLNGFTQPSNEIDMDDLEPDDESMDTPLFFILF
nr:hypothetical protein [Tanacetum cinerariifolium]